MIAMNAALEDVYKKVFADSKRTGRSNWIRIERDKRIFEMERRDVETVIGLINEHVKLKLMSLKVNDSMQVRKLAKECDIVKWHNRTSRTRSTETSDGLAAIQAQLNNLGREIKKVSEKVYAAQVGCELCKGPHYTKDCPLKERNNANPSYQEQTQSMEESLSKFMNESGKRHEENSNLVKEIRASTDNSKLIFEPRQTTIPFPIRLYDDCYDEEKGSHGLKYLDAYSIGTTLRNDSLPKKEKYPGSFTLPCYINNICFEKALADLGASASVMPLSTYLNLGLGDLAHTKLTVELVDRTVKHPKGIAENILVGIVVEDMDPYPDEGMRDVIVGEPFCKASCVEDKMFDGIITICDEDDSVTYQMVSEQDKMNEISHSYQMLKGFYKGVLNLGPEFIRDANVEERLTRGHISVYEME
ncbi:ribonuclease H-like domain-containing protein [Tanacetum coccineum]